MFIAKLGMVLAFQLLVLAVGFYFLHLSKKENSKPLKVGGLIVSIAGILVFLSTAAVGVKKMSCWRCHHMMKFHHGGEMGSDMDKGYCPKEKMKEEGEEEKED